jgi:hypothetical protein
MPSGNRQHRQLAQVAAMASRSCVAWTEVDEQASRIFEPSAAHISSMDLAMSTL